MKLLKIENEQLELREITDVQVRKHLVSRVGGLKYASTVYLHTEDKIYEETELVEKPKTCQVGDSIMTSEEGDSACINSLHVEQLLKELDALEVPYTLEEV